MRTFIHAIILAAALSVAVPTLSIASTSNAEMMAPADEGKAKIVVNQSTVRDLPVKPLRLCHLPADM